MARSTFVRSISVYFPSSLDGEKVLAKLEAEAKRTGRSLNWVITRVLRDYTLGKKEEK